MRKWLIKKLVSKDEWWLLSNGRREIETLKRDVDNLRGKNGVDKKIETTYKYQFMDDALSSFWAGETTYSK